MSGKTSSNNISQTQTGYIWRSYE